MPGSLSLYAPERGRFGWACSLRAAGADLRTGWIRLRSAECHRQAKRDSFVPNWVAPPKLLVSGAIEMG